MTRLVRHVLTFLTPEHGVARMRAAARHADPRVVEALAFVVLLAWAVALPYTSKPDPYTALRTYYGMSSWGPLWSWKLVSAALASFSLCALIRPRVYLRLMSVGLFGLWCAFLAMAGTVRATVNPLTLQYLGMSALGAWAFMRISEQLSEGSAR